MQRNILPRGLNHKDIWETFPEAHLPAPCEHCGKEATPNSLLMSRKHYRMDLCSKCRHLKYQGALDDPDEQFQSQDIMEVYGDSKELPF